MRPPVTVFDHAEALGAAVAAEMARLLADSGGRMVLGVPAGRTPKPAFAAFARLAAKRSLDLSGLQVVMMDEYVEAAPGGRWRLVPRSVHYSCRAFVETHLRAGFNAGLPPARQLPASQVFTPDPDDPAAYDARIESLGGVDLFILASGASDGHVAFNPPGTPRAQGTAVTRLAEATRRDNLATFPDFRSLEETPTHGVGVGPATIARLSKAAILILTGAHKREAFRRIAAADRYDAAWPATVITECRNARIFADRAAAGP